MSRKIVTKSLWFTVLSLLASLLNFAFYPAIAFFLSKAQFGDVQVGVSFIMLAASLFTSLSTLALFFAAQEKNNPETMRHLERLVMFISLIGSGIVLVFSHQIANVLQLADASLLYMLAFIFIINIPAGTWIGTLQGQGQFIASGSISVVSALTKIIVAIGLIQLGWGAHGALAGIAVGTIVMLPLVKLIQHKKLASFRHTFRIIGRRDVAFFRNNPIIITMLLSLIVFSTIGTLDVLWAKYMLSPHDAGVFAQLSTIAKIPYFAMIPVAIIIFERLTRHTLPFMQTAVQYGILCAIIGGIVWLFHGLLANVLFHITSPGVTLPILIIGFTLYAVFTLQIYLLIVRRDIKRLLISVSVAILLIIAGLILFGKDPTTTATAFTGGIALSLLLSVVLRYTELHERN